MSTLFCAMAKEASLNKPENSRRVVGGEEVSGDIMSRGGNREGGEAGTAQIR